MSERTRPPVRSDIAWSNAERIVIRGHDLVDDLLGKVDLGDFGFLELFHRLPDESESTVFNAMLVSLAEHGLTPNALAARLTYLGAPESLQGAVAAGLLGLGTTFVGTIEGTARMLQEAPAQETWRSDQAALQQVATRIAEEFVAARRPVPGIGHPIHKPVDPRAERLFGLARDNGLDDSYERLLRAIQAVAQDRLDRELPINVTGAIGSISTTMGLRWQVSRGLGVMARAVGLVGHILEELDQPIAQTVQYDAEKRAVAHMVEGDSHG
ncbi:MAG: Citrate synthase [Frankiales bacterium]|nr:Citrate synthase [Frankiales bacterium]